jgi:biopolymer transport protein ExbD
MGMQFTKRPRPTIQAPLTSLIDIVFMLLIYFLLTTNFMVDEAIKINLPQADASSPQMQKELVIYVDGQGQTWIGQERVQESKLFSTIKTSLAQRQRKVVIIKADRSLVLNKAVRIMDMVKAAGAEKISLATEKHGESWQ